MKDKLLESGIIGKISKEEMCLDLYVYEEMKKLGYDIYAFDSSNSNSKYDACADKAIECLIEGKPIPEDIKRVLLNEKKRREKDLKEKGEIGR